VVESIIYAIEIDYSFFYAICDYLDEFIVEQEDESTSISVDAVAKKPGIQVLILLIINRFVRYGI